MYSFFCKSCNDSFSGTKEEVRKYRKNHKVKGKFSLMTETNACPMQLTLRGTLARPSLAIMIDEEIKLKQAN